MNQIKDAAETKECPDCASLNIVYNEQREQLVCKDCGLIFEQMIPLEGTTPVEILPKKTKAQTKNKSKKKNKR